MKAIIVRKRSGGERTIPRDRLHLNRFTEIGESAEYYEKMPHTGRRWIDPKTIVRIER